MNTIHENDVVALLIDQPDAGLQRGDVGTVIQVLESSSDHPAGLIVVLRRVRKGSGSNRHY
jgi:uncharacterized protein YwbE